jgi:hypothetical protein
MNLDQSTTRVSGQTYFVHKYGSIMGVDPRAIQRWRDRLNLFIENELRQF